MNFQLQGLIIIASTLCEHFGYVQVTANLGWASYRYHYGTLHIQVFYWFYVLLLQVLLFPVSGEPIYLYNIASRLHNVP